ncbi:10880_t:CDS:1, partial [Cetraspora pellucida]
TIMLCWLLKCFSKVEFSDLSENSNLHLLQIGLFGLSTLKKKYCHKADSLFDEIVFVSDVKVDSVLVFNIEIAFVSNIDNDELVFISDVRYGELVFASNIGDNSLLYRA